MRIKLRDVAQRANVSVATVSRVINGSPDVNERTRQEILVILSQLGYPLPEITIEPVQNVNREILVITRGVKNNSFEKGSYTDGNGLDESLILHSDFDPLVIDGVEVVLRKLGFPMHIKRVILENPGEEDLEQLKGAKGIIIVGGIVGRKFISELERLRLPFVLAGAHLGDKDVNCVLGDYLQSCAAIVTTLSNTFGHSRIALINGPATTSTSADKLAGYRLGLSEVGLGYEPGLVVAAADFDHYAGYKATQQLLAQGNHFTAVMYASDQLAIGGLRAFKEARLNVPKDVSVVGFYNGAIAQFTDPPLSTVNLDRRRLGAIAAQRLISMLDYQDYERLRIVIPTQLIMRASTASPRL